MKRFTVIFSAVILTVIGFFLIFLGIGWIPAKSIEQILISIQERIIPAIVVGILLLGGGVYLIYLLVREIRYGLAISFQNPEGEVRVSTGAVEEFLKRLERGFDEVREMKPELSITKKGLEITAWVMLEPNVNIPEATTRVQETIREYVEGVLGIKKIVSIKVFITKIAREEGKKEIESTRS